jgi:hypothetical protein
MIQTRLPTAQPAYGLERPSASRTVDNLNPQAIHLRNPKSCLNKRSHFYAHAQRAREAAEISIMFPLLSIRENHKGEVLNVHFGTVAEPWYMELFSRIVRNGKI